MKFFKKAIKEAQEIDEAVESLKETPEPTPEPEEEWVWVEGYKGTDKDMKCCDFQYELGPQYDVPDDQKVVKCKNGFHLCLELDDVFEYYDIGDGCRFFKVKALVRKSDKDKYGTHEKYIDGWGCVHNTYRNNKLVARSIIFTSELTADEILEGTAVQNLPEQYKQLAIEVDVQYAVENYKMDILIEDGYSQPFARYIVQQKLFDIAHAVGSQKDLSMDMKVLAILHDQKGK